MTRNDEKRPKIDVSAGESNKKISLIFLMGYPNTLKLTKYQKFFEFHALKQRNCIIVIPDFSKISTC